MSTYSRRCRGDPAHAIRPSRAVIQRILTPASYQHQRPPPQSLLTPRPCDARRRPHPVADHPAGDRRHRAFDTRQQSCFYARLCGGAGVGRQAVGVGNRKAGNAWLKWAFSQAAVLRPSRTKHRRPAGRLASRLGKPKALSALAHKDAPRRQALPPGCGEQQATRNVFVARAGHVLVSLDLSAAEPRYLAMLFQRALEQKHGPYLVKREELY